MVQRSRCSGGIKPHVVRTFKLSNAPHFQEELVDVVGGLPRSPRARCGVFCGRKRSQIRALDPTRRIG